MKIRKAYLNILLATAILVSGLAWRGAAAEASLAEIDGIVRYVKSGGLVTGECLDWGTACELHHALSIANGGEEVWVAEGMYYPTTSETDLRLATFGLVSGVALYGGFEGGETSLEQCNWTAHPTILSGDIDGDGFLNDGNVYHVVTGTEVDSTTVLDGFTITAGLASTNGAGIYLIQSNPTLKNIIIFGNKAVNNGGGMWNDYSNPDLTNVLIFGNSIGGSGAAMWNHYSSPTLTNVTIYGNVSTFRCGGCITRIIASLY